jgi:ribosomal protein S18 acetylase RimI-like enzyme
VILDEDPAVTSFGATVLGRLVGLNVRVDNRAAITWYEAIGFTTKARYELQHLRSG